VSERRREREREQEEAEVEAAKERGRKEKRRGTQLGLQLRLHMQRGIGDREGLRLITVNTAAAAVPPLLFVAFTQSDNRSLFAKNLLASSAVCTTHKSNFYSVVRFVGFFLVCHTQHT